MDGRPYWSRRLRREREARGWSQRDTVRELRQHAEDGQLPSEETLIRRWKSWESGEHRPDDRYERLIANTFRTARHALFPAPDTPRASAEMLAATGVDTLELIARVRGSNVDAATLDAIGFTVDRLCSEYPYRSAGDLLVEARRWLRRVAELRDHRVTLAQHREILTYAGWLALLTGCLENDLGERRTADATRRAALTLGAEADNAGIRGWGHEMRAWFALTDGDPRGVLDASEAGIGAGGQEGATVQLRALQAKAYARLGDRSSVDRALDDGRRRLDALPYPDNTAHHFVVDPAKFDYYRMDSARVAADDPLARSLAEDVLREAINKPMRQAEARVTLAVVAAREGDLEQALHHGRTALDPDRVSIPSMGLIIDELRRILVDRYGGDPAVRDYFAEVESLA